MAKMIFDLDMDKCVACGACAIACMDQNDIWPNKGDVPFRSVGTLEPLLTGDKIGYFSIACMHCEDAPCIPACPSACLRKNDMWLTVYDNTACIGCHSCALACPVGAPTYGADGRMRKCDGCEMRLRNGLLPACVRICPTGALTCRMESEYAPETAERSLRRAIDKSGLVWSR